MWFDADTSNSGNIQFSSCKFHFFTSGIHIEGGQTNNNFKFDNTKFLVSTTGAPDTFLLTAASHSTEIATLTLGAGVVGDEITLPSGFDLADGDNIFFGGETGSEVHTVKSYSGTTLTLYNGLNRAYTADDPVVLMGGGDSRIAISTGSKAPAIHICGCHFEGCSIILWSAPVFTIQNCMISTQTQDNAFGQNDEYPITVSGNSNFLGKIEQIFYSETRADDKLVQIIENSGGNRPGNIFVGHVASTSGMHTDVIFVQGAGSANIRSCEFTFDKADSEGVIDWNRGQSKIDRVDGTGLRITGTEDNFEVEGSFESGTGTTTILGLPSSEPADGELEANQITFWLNEASSPDVLNFKMKDSAGTPNVRKGTITLDTG
jgi:hypothetical protein